MIFCLRPISLKSICSVLLISSLFAQAEETSGYLEKQRHHVMVTTTIPDSGDQNPYAVVVAPVSSGTIQAGDVLIDNFNNSANLQGTGASIVDYNPSTKKLSTFAQLP